MLATFSKLLKRHLTNGVVQAAKQLREELRIFWVHRRTLKRLAREQITGEIKLNCGCADKLKKGWINVDIYYTKADLLLDLRESLPFASGTVSIIYSEHFFEHLSYPEQVSIFLTESIRVLKQGGIFSMGIPDTEQLMQAYVSRDCEYFKLCREVWHPLWCDTWMHSVNYHFRQGQQHKYCWDFETLEKILKANGFDRIRQRQFDSSLDSESRRLGTLYIEARKPD